VTEPPDGAPPDDHRLGREPESTSPADLGGVRLQKALPDVVREMRGEAHGLDYGGGGLTSATMLAWSDAITAHLARLAALVAKVWDLSRRTHGLSPDDTRIELQDLTAEVRALLGPAVVDSATASNKRSDVEQAACTGVAASWCPRCGDCSCPHLATGEREDQSESCPLHGHHSAHAEDTTRPDSDEWPHRARVQELFREVGALRLDRDSWRKVAERFGSELDAANLRHAETKAELETCKAQVGIECNAKHEQRLRAEAAEAKVGELRSELAKARAEVARIAKLNRDGLSEMVAIQAKLAALTALVETAERDNPISGGLVTCKALRAALTAPEPSLCERGLHSFSWRYAGQPCHYCNAPPTATPAEPTEDS
jgi:hypothetical protein